MRAQELIFITHPDLKGTRQVPKRSFDILWSHRGWVAVVGDTEASVSEGEQDVPLADLARAKLLTIAEALELEIPASWNKGQIVEAIEATQTGEGPELTPNTEGDQPDNAQEG